MEKQRQLSALGFERSNLRLAVAVHMSLGVHMVLIVNSDRGDIVLDNLTDKVRLVNRTGYVFLERQSTGSDLDWRKVTVASNR